MKNKKSVLEKFKNSQIENDLEIAGGASSIMTYMQEKTYVFQSGDTRHTCDTTLNDTVVVGYSF